MPVSLFRQGVTRSYMSTGDLDILIAFLVLLRPQMGSLTPNLLEPIMKDAVEYVPDKSKEQVSEEKEKEE